MGLEEKVATDASTEEKIKKAARKLFTQKGYDAVKTRDIATEAGINLALLNYYFRGKQKLYDIIMHENLASFKKGISSLFADESVDVFAKIEKMAIYYIDTLLANPSLALFIVNEINNSSHLHHYFDETNEEVLESRAVFVKQFQKLVEDGVIAPIHPVHVIGNLMGLIIMPFLAKPLILRRLGLEDDGFIEVMKQRKKLIPVWIELILKGNNNKD